MASDQAPTFYRNPSQGTVLYVAAGGQLDAEFDFLNDSPDVAMFCLESDGLPDRRWVTGTGTDFEVAAAAAGGGTLRIRLAPAIDAAPGNYPFSLRILSANSVIGPQLNLTLSVGPAVKRDLPPTQPLQPLQPLQPPTPKPPVAPAGQPNFVPDPNRTWIAADDPGWNNPNNPAWNAAKVPEAPRQPSWSPPPSASAPAQPAWNAPATPSQPAWNAPQAPAAPTPPAWNQQTQPPAASVQPPPQQTGWPQQNQHPAPPVPPARPPQPPTPPQPSAAAAQLQRPAPPPVPPARPPQAPTPPAQPAPPWNPVQPAAPSPPWNAAPAQQNTSWNNSQAPAAEEEPLHIVDLPTQAAPEEREEEVAAPIVPVEPSVISPRNGASFPVRPGNTLLVRFPFVNTTSATTTYVLDEDRSLPQGWITLVQDQVNLTKNAEGEVSFRLSPQLTAEAGEYPFTVSVGPQGGQIVQYQLTLQVPVVPGVLLNAKSTKAKMGPFSHAADLHFFAEINGNADTAFRVSIKSQEDGQRDRDIYETPNWRYVFDKELDTLEAPSVHRASTPVPLRLRVERRGTWWFGFKETDNIRVVAVPVTEPDNGGKPGNTLDLMVSRWRILPIPLGLFIPILLFLVILGSGGAKTFEASNAVLDDQGHYWAVQPPGEHKTVGLSWDADPLALLKLKIMQGDTAVVNKTYVGTGKYTENVDVSNQDRKIDRNYSVTRIMGGGDQQLSVSYIYTSSNTPLQVIDGTTGRVIAGGETTINVPATGYGRLVLKNASTQFTRIDWWLPDTLDPDDPFKFLYVKNSGSIQPGETETFLIQRNTANPMTDTRIVFITTDATRPTLTVHLTAN